MDINTFSPIPNDKTQLSNKRDNNTTISENNNTINKNTIIIETNASESVESNPNDVLPLKQKHKSKHFPHQFGNLFLFCFKNKNNPLIVIGPDYHFFIIGFFTFTLFDIVLYSFMWSSRFVFLNLIGIIISGLHIGFYIWTFLSNPGVMLIKPSPGRETDACEQCGCIMLRNVKQKHCDICNACFIGIDHHCPWTSKCIAQENIQYFQLFMIFTMVQFVYVVVFVSFYH